MKRFVLEEYGPEVQAVIDKVQELVRIGGDDATLFTREEREKLNSIGIEYNTTEYWDLQTEYIPDKGTIVIYSDYYKLEDENGNIITNPGIKVGSGNAYLSDLVFVGNIMEIKLEKHISDTEKHTSIEEKKRWDNKLNIEDEVDDENLVFNRE